VYHLGTSRLKVNESACASRSVRLRQGFVGTSPPAFVRTLDEENFRGPAEASSESWGPHGSNTRSNSCFSGREAAASF